MEEHDAASAELRARRALSEASCAAAARLLSAAGVDKGMVAIGG